MVMVMKKMEMKMAMVTMMRMMMTLTNPFVSSKFHCEVDLCLAACSNLTSKVRIRIRMTMMAMRLPTVTWHHFE